MQEVVTTSGSGGAGTGVRADLPPSEGEGSAPTRARTPWLLLALAIVVLAGTLTLGTLNGSEEDDALFIPLAVTMIVGYSVGGALLASRAPRNSIGWLMIGTGLAFALVGLTEEYTIYTFETNPGSLPFGRVTALISSVMWMPLLTSIILLALLFPTGTVPGPRWRYLLWAIVGLMGLYLVGSLLTPGRLEASPDVPIQNPIGIPGLRSVGMVAAAVGGIALLLCAVPSIAALVLRYRRSRGEERQQIRWLAYIGGTVLAFIVIGLVLELVLGDSFDSPWSGIFFFTIFTLVAIGVPAAMGIAILRYRLYDLDLVIRKTLLYATVAVLLTSLFLVVALVIGRVAGRSDAGAVVAAGVIGLSFWPAVRVSRRVADRIVYGRRATPYEVLSEFCSRVRDSYRDEDVLARMAEILGAAVGASRATVWLRVGDELRPAAASPAADTMDPAQVVGAAGALPALPADTAVEVRDGGELLGALTVSMPPNDPMTPSKDRLVRDLASQAGLVLRNVRLIAELRESRRRIVTEQDERRRKLERDIHDGAQQQLVALMVKLRLAEQLAGRDIEKTREMLVQLQSEATEALETLRDLARGIYPPLLADGGLAVALASQARKAPLPVEVEADGLGRYPQEVEAAVYFCCLEALQNVVKYAKADRVRVRLGQEDGYLTFRVEDDGVGFDPTAAQGSGLRNMRDRVEALGGEVEIRSDSGRGTTVIGRVATRTLMAS